MRTASGRQEENSFDCEHPEGGSKNREERISRLLPEAKEEKADGKESQHDSPGKKLADEWFHGQL